MSARLVSPLTPRERIEAECGRRGVRAVVEGCVALLAGGDAGSEPAVVDTGLVVALGGDHGVHVLDPATRGDQRYWLRVWAARGLLWAWEDGVCDDTTQSALREAMSDPTWRVREMACKVVARHLLGDCLDAVAALAGDPVPRVRQASGRAVARLTEHSA